MPTLRTISRRLIRLTVKESEAGPNGRNNLDPNAPGAIAGLDPREAVGLVDQRRRLLELGPPGWSLLRQRELRRRHAPAALCLADLARRPSRSQISPTCAYWGTCTPCTLTAGAVPRRTTFTEAGGYAPVGKTVGVVTVRNMRTGQSGHTAALGSGIRRGALSPQVTVEVGDSYQITHTGTVYKDEADGYLVSDPRSRLRLRRLPPHHHRPRRRPRRTIRPTTPLRGAAARAHAAAPARPSCPSARAHRVIRATPFGVETAPSRRAVEGTRTGDRGTGTRWGGTGDRGRGAREDPDQT